MVLVLMVLLEQIKTQLRFKMNLRENPQSVYAISLINAPAPAYRYETNQTWTLLPVIPAAANKPINIQENFGENRPAYYNPLPTPIDQAYYISRQTNCMGGAPRLPGLLPCPYGTDAIACAYHAA